MSAIPLFTRIKTRWFYALTPHKATDGIFSLLFPLYLVNVMHTQIATVGLLTALISLTSVPGSMFWGYLSDHRRTRRSLLVLGQVGSAICLAGMGVAWTVPQMAILCLAYGVFSVAPAPISSVLIMETTSKEQWEKVFGTFNKIGGWGWVGGLALGFVGLLLLGPGVAAHRNLRLLFVVLAVVTAGSAWWVWRTLPEPVRRVRRRQFVEVTRRLPTLSAMERVLYMPQRLLFVLQPGNVLRLKEFVQRPILRYLLATAIMFLSFTMALTLFPLFLQTTFQFDMPTIFACVLVRALASVPCYERAGDWTRRLGAKQIQLLALSGRCLMFLGFCSLLWLSHPGIIVTMLVGMNALAGLTWSGIAIAGPVLVGRLTAEGQKGEAMGMYNATQGVAQIIGPVLGGYLAQWAGYYGVFAIAAALLLPAIGLLVSLPFTQALSKPRVQSPRPRAVGVGR